MGHLYLFATTTSPYCVYGKSSLDNADVMIAGCLFAPFLCAPNCQIKTCSDLSFGLSLQQIFSPAVCRRTLAFSATVGAATLLNILYIERGS